MKPQSEKSEAHIELQPKNMEKNSVQHIMAYDLAGYCGNEIAQLLEMTPSRISIIKNSPLYMEERKRRFEALKSQVTGTVVKQIMEDPARKILMDHRAEFAAEKVKLALESKSDFVRNAATSECLDRLGVYPEQKKDKASVVTVVMEEKMARRFGFAKDYIPPTSPEGLELAGAHRVDVIERKVTTTVETHA